VNHK